MFSLLDWIILIVPFLAIVSLAIYSRKYVRSVVDYLAAGRVAGRYVMSVGDMASALSVITLVASVEANYRTGSAMGFWNIITIPLGMVLALSGYCTYRYRATKALSIGQFLEERYSHRFRIFAATLRTISEMITNAIGPAIAANFFIYFMGLPHRVNIFGLNLPCFVLVVAMCLIIAMVVLWPAGRISLLITDTFQGLISYPIFVIIAGYIFFTFSWGDEIVPVLLDRVPGESFLNPYDIDKLRDFNLFGLVVTILSSILNRASWFGNDTSSCGKTPHEQKMAGVLGTWRSGFSWLMISLIAVLVITVMNLDTYMESKDNKKGFSSHRVRQELISKVAEQIIADNKTKSDVQDAIMNIPVQHHIIGTDAPLSRSNNIDTPYIDVAHKALYNNIPDEHRAEYEAINAAAAEGKKIVPSPELAKIQGEQAKKAQELRTVYGQMMMPIVLRNILPMGLLGLFGLLMIMLLISTDDSRIFNASSTLVQDVILPFYKKPPSFKSHLLMLRLTSAAVAVFFFFVALFFSQLDYINMFVTIMTALWLGGAGPVMIFGLYSRFGNTAGAWAALAFGSGTSLLGLIFQRNWADSIVPFLRDHGMIESTRNFLASISKPFNPWIDWNFPIDKAELVARGSEAFASIDSFFVEKFPINSLEISFISMVLSVIAYIAASYIAIKCFGVKLYNLDKLLHRGEYADEETIKQLQSQSQQRKVSIISRLVGITKEYTRGDRLIAWSVFVYTIIYKIVFCFIVVIIVNNYLIAKNGTGLSPKFWGNYYFYTNLLIPAVIGVLTTVWFMWGGIKDGIQLFKDLQNRTEDLSDNGWIDASKKKEKEPTESEESNS